MKQIRTHYDNLKVARNAPLDVISAAYKALSQKYHPDRNPGSTEAARIMVIINTAYEVLSNTDKRKEHDLWVLQKEQAFSQSGKARPNNQPQQEPPGTQFQLPPVNTIVVHLRRNWLFYVAAILFLIWIWDKNNAGITRTSPIPYQEIPAQLQNPAQVPPKYIRPKTAPNNNPWPISAGYVNGYERLNSDGLSTITVDNIHNDYDVFVKLVSLDSGQAYSVRQFYIPAFGTFTLNKITKGNYEIHYWNLSNGVLSSSESFNLQEIPNHNSTQFSNITMTLYKVKNGNMQTHSISESEF